MTDSKDLTAKQIASRAAKLYSVLPAAGFTRATFEELGVASWQGKPFRELSAECKAAIMKLVIGYEAETEAEREGGSLQAEATPEAAKEEAAEAKEPPITADEIILPSPAET